METVKIKRDKLLKTVKDNKEKHMAIFKEAQVGYREAAIKLLDQMLEEAMSGGPIKRQLSLVEPICSEKEYDRIIRMLEMSTERTIELSQGEFTQYVMDEWGWKHQFMASNVSYTKSFKEV